LKNDRDDRSLGLDGAKWDLLDLWLESGDLPNIQLLREKDKWSDMESQ
jgi:hypothetical protein